MKRNTVMFICFLILAGFVVYVGLSHYGIIDKKVVNKIADGAMARPLDNGSRSLDNGCGCNLPLDLSEIPSRNELIAKLTKDFGSDPIITHLPERDIYLWDIDDENITSISFQGDVLMAVVKAQRFTDPERALATFSSMLDYMTNKAPVTLLGQRENTLDDGSPIIMMAYVCNCNTNLKYVLSAVDGEGFILLSVAAILNTD